MPGQDPEVVPGRKAVGKRTANSFTLKHVGLSLIRFMEAYMPNFRDLNRETMAGPITFTYWRGEVDELLVEVRAGNLAGMREEWSDVTCLAMLYLLAQGWPVGWLPVLPGLGLYAARKFERRLVTWERIFAHHDVRFENRYIIGGGNYRKGQKVINALALAGVQVVDVGWLVTEGIVTE